jgi:hypothetical protein
VVSVLAALSVGLASRAAHATSCTASADFGTYETSGTCGVGVGGQSAFVGPNGGYLKQAYAASQPGGLAILANAQAFSNSSYYLPSSNASAFASFRVDDIIFRASAAGPTSVIDVALNIAVSGLLTAWVLGNSTHPEGGGLASVALNVVVNLNGYSSTGWQSFSCNGSGCGGTSSGIFAAAAIGQFTSCIARVPVGTPVSLEVRAQFDGPRSIDCAGLCGAIGAYGQTISLPTSGPVFSLPDGYTVDSASLSLQDNLWLGSPPQIQEELAYLVPEPAVTGLAAASAIALARPGRRRARNGAGAARAPETA